jgi:Mg/Co/Ni transporter MgtE
MQTLADLDEQALSKCLPEMDPHDLTLAIRQMEPEDQGKILAKIDQILGTDYAEILKMAVLQG